MGQFVRRTTHRVVFLQRCLGMTARARKPRPALSPNSVSPRNRVEASTQNEKEPRVSTSMSDLSDVKSEDREVDSRDEGSFFRLSESHNERIPKRTMNSVDSDPNHDKPLPKQQQFEIGQCAKQTKGDTKVHEDDRTVITAAQQLLQERSLWLFNKDRQNLSALSETDRQTQLSLAQFQKNLMQIRPDEHMFLCIMSLSREVRELIFAAKFAHIPKVMVTRTYRYNDIHSLPEKVDLLPPICYVSRQTFGESVPVLLRGRKVILGKHRARLFASVLADCKSNSGFTAVTSLTFENSGQATGGFFGDDDRESNKINEMHLYHRWGYGDMLVACCSALKTLTIEVHCDELSKTNRIGISGNEYSDSEDEIMTLKNVEELQATLPIGALRRCLAFNLLRVIVLNGTLGQECLQSLTDYLGKRLPLVAPQAIFEISRANYPPPCSFMGFQDEV